MFYKSAKKLSHTLAASAAINGVDLPAWVYAKPEPEAHATTPHDAAVITNDLLTRAEAARYLRVSDRMVSRLIRKGQLPASRIGRAVRIRYADLLGILDGNPRISVDLGTHREWAPPHAGEKSSLEKAISTTLNGKIPVSGLVRKWCTRSDSNARPSDS